MASTENVSISKIDCPIFYDKVGYINDFFEQPFL